MNIYITLDAEKSLRINGDEKRILNRNRPFSVWLCLFLFCLVEILFFSASFYLI